MKLQWQQAPVKTQWGDEMVVASVAIDKDHTVCLYCERDQTPKVEAMFALAEQPAQQEPAFHGFMDEERCCVNICYTPWAPGGPNNELPTAYYTSPPAQQEPVAWMNAKRDMTYLYGPYNADDIPLYTSPPAQRKPLTDDEFISMVDSAGIAIDPVLAFEIKEMVEAAHGIKENT